MVNAIGARKYSVIGEGLKTGDRIDFRRLIARRGSLTRRSQRFRSRRIVKGKSSGWKASLKRSASVGGK